VLEVVEDNGVATKQNNRAGGDCALELLQSVRVCVVASALICKKYAGRFWNALPKEVMQFYRENVSQGYPIL